MEQNQKSHAVANGNARIAATNPENRKRCQEPFPITRKRFLTPFFS